jgi:hypothetical protein
MTLQAEEDELNGSTTANASEEYGEVDDVWDDIADKMLTYSNEVSITAICALIL